MQPFAGSTSAEDPPLEPVFFLDEDTSSKLVVAALREAGAVVKVYGDVFEPGVDDQIWLPQVAADGWAILSRDRGIARSSLERQAVIEAKARKFTLRSKRNLTGAEMARAFVKALPAMRAIIAVQLPPFFARVYRDGSVRFLGVS